MPDFLSLGAIMLDQHGWIVNKAPASTVNSEGKCCIFMGLCAISSQACVRTQPSNGTPPIAHVDPLQYVD